MIDVIYISVSCIIMRLFPIPLYLYLYLSVVPLGLPLA